MLQSFHDQIQASMASHTASSHCVYHSVDRAYFETYPFTFFSNDLERVLPELRTRFAIRASSNDIGAAINSATWPQAEVDPGLGYGLSVVDHASQLTSVLHNYLPAAFIRADSSLVLWGDDEGWLLSTWSDIVNRIQIRFGCATTIVPVAGQSVDSEESLSLPMLDDFPFLSTFNGLTESLPSTSTPYSFPDPTWSMEGDSPDVTGLQLALDVLSTSPSSDNASFGFVSPFSGDLESISPRPPNTVDLSDEEDTTSDFSQEISSTMSEDGASSDGSQHAQVQPYPVSASATGTFRRHSVGEASAPLARAIGQKTKRGDNEGGDSYGQNANLDTEASGRGVNVNQHLLSGVRASKRMRSVTAATSAPPRLPIPLPDVERTPSDPAASGSADEGDNSATLLHAPAPVFLAPSPSPSSARSPTPAPGQRNRGRRRGGTARAKRTPCNFCPKTFSRMQDAQRHMDTSCMQNPEKQGVQCPECGAVLSRLDAAQRHWRGHENPSCEAPEWANRA
ncbi:hypothetical protein BC826DRAFT_34644 [Russula brevipes]|nr:hypothetical protein BC826DRAFT_34644 [Russula brevipes]